MNKKTVLACAIIGVLTNGQPVLAGESNGEHSFQAGEGATSPGTQSVAIGPESSSKGHYSVAAGNLAKSEGFDSISLGVESNSKGDYSLAQGYQAKSDGLTSIAIGVGSKANKKDSIAVGHNTVNDGASSVVIGEGTESKGDYSLALGYQGKSTGTQSVAIGPESSSKGDYSVAAGKSANSEGSHSISLGVDSNSKGDYSLALGSFSQADRKYDDLRLKAIWAEQDNKLNAKKIREISLGVLKDNHDETILGQITHVASGTEDTDAVNFYQLKRVKRDLDERIGEVDKIKTTKNNVERLENEARSASQVTAQHRDNAKGASEMARTALTETQTHRDNAKGASEMAKTVLTETQTHRDNAYDALTMVKVHENSADSILKRLEREASLVEGVITHGSDGTMYIGKELEGSQIFVTGKQGDRVIRGVASGVRSSDAVNVSQLNTVRTTANYASQLAQKNSSRINHLEDKLSKTNTKIERGLATSAALTGLFQPYGVGRVNFTASIGGYGASQALAVGTGYRVTENAAVKAGVAYSGGNHVMYNASFNFEF